MTGSLQSLEALALGDSVYVERLKEADALHPGSRQNKNSRNELKGKEK